MYKLIDSSSFFSQDEPQVNVLDMSDTSSLIKSAADARVNSYVKSIKPKEGKMYLHINAMGAGEYYGANRNGDYFPEENLKKYHKTFEEFGHVFRHHINKDPAKAIGKVLFSIYNENMHRVELVVEVDKSLGKDIEERIGRGDYPATSMACKTPFDTCSVCGNRAQTRQAYCSHLKTELGKMKQDGRKTMAINDGPLKFFDISIVVVPADPSSYILQKVAGVDYTVSSAELAEMEGLSDHGDDTIKEASFKKLSELVKEIDGQVTASGPLKDILDQVKDPAESVMASLAKFSLEQVINAFAELGMAPSIPFLCDFIATKHGKPELGQLAARYLKVIPFPENMVMDMIERLKIANKPSHPVLIKLLAPYMNQSSLHHEFVEKRAYASGYAAVDYKFEENKTPERELTNKELFKKLALNNPSILHALLVIGTSAIAARIMLNSMVEKKIREAQAKISLQKQAKIDVSGPAGTAAALGTAGLSGYFMTHPDKAKDIPASQTLTSHPILATIGVGGLTRGILKKAEEDEDSLSTRIKNKFTPTGAFISGLQRAESKAAGAAGGLLAVVHRLKSSKQKPEQSG